MRIGVIGPRTTAAEVQTIVKKEMPDIHLVVIENDNYEECAEIADEWQRKQKVDAILFTGPSNYSYAIKRVTPRILWGYLPHNRLSVLQALYKGLAVFQWDTRGISIDTYEEEIVRDVLESVGICDTSIIKAPFDAETTDYERHLRDFHREQYLSDRVSLCITSAEHICQPLLDEGIPCVRIYPVREIIQEQIHHLEFLKLTEDKKQSQLAVIAIHYDYVFDQEKELNIREWEKMIHQNEFKERVYACAQRLDAAVYECGLTIYFLCTTRNMVENVFLKNHENSKLMQFDRKLSHHQVWLGIGIGSTMLEAQSRATMALNHAKIEASGTVYLAEQGSDITRIQNDPEIAPTSRQATDFSQKSGIGLYTLYKLGTVIKNQGDTLTSKDLSAFLGITSRSANRILMQLEEAGCLITVGKQTSGKGRPARIVKISLPEAFTNIDTI
ncbi:MAG: helix-turn-helix domain-containing protein [Lachnospiraceae bacterium]|nr:helix-turn-helix domain-containing protein [Lachnospiraceae bacterium]